MKEKTTPAGKSSEKNDEIEELKNFIDKKKTQNVALKKIMSKLNTDEDLKNYK